MNYNYQTSTNQTNLITSVKFWVLTLILVLLYSVLIFAQSTIYIDPTNSGDPGQNGTIDHPYDSWSDFTVQNNNTYLMKKGTSITNASPISMVSKSNVTISTYGTGEKPHIIYAGGGANLNADGCNNILIEGIIFEGGESGVISCGAHGGRSASNQTIRNCETIGGWRGINSEVWEPETGHISDLLIENCIIHGCSTDGIFAKSNTNETYNGITIRGCHIYDVNQKWLELQNGTCDGDCIHLLRAGNVLIEDNILDRRGTSYKFSVIVIGRTDTEVATVRNNVIYPPNQHDVWSSNAFYFQILGEVNFIGNKVIGSQMPSGASSTACGILRAINVNVSYNLFDYVGVIVGTGAPTPFTHQYNNNIVRFYLQGDENYFLNSGNQPIYMRNNIFMMPNDTYLVNDGMHGGVNVFKTNNLELYSDDLSYFDNLIHFANITAGDFHLTENSTLARNQGIEYTGALNYDLDSIPVPQETSRDIGSFEYFDGGQINNPPVIANQTFSVPENSTAGTNVGTVVATDPDAGQTLTYSILSGNTGNAFQINASTGVLTVATPSAINFEVTPTFSLIVKVQDNGSGSLSSQATITINLIDVNEIPEIYDQSFWVPENSATGTTVGTVVAGDPDAGQTLSYVITNGNINNAFQINSTSGLISVDNTEAINFEAMPAFSLTVEVTDNGTGNLSSQAVMTIDIHDINEQPVIPCQYFWVKLDISAIINETSIPVYKVGVVEASDPDAGQSLTFSLEEMTGNEIWEIGSQTGELVIANPYALIFEPVSNYTLMVTVEDDALNPLSSTATIFVNVEIMNWINDIETDVEEPEDDQVVYNLFPNPVMDFMNIELRSLCMELVQTTIFNLCGEVVLAKEYLVTDGKLTDKLDLSSLKRGAYIIKFNSCGKWIIEKLVKL